MKILGVLAGLCQITIDRASSERAQQPVPVEDVLGTLLREDAMDLAHLVRHRQDRDGRRGRSPAGRARAKRPTRTPSSQSRTGRAARAAPGLGLPHIDHRSPPITRNNERQSRRLAQPAPGQRKIDPARNSGAYRMLLLPQRCLVVSASGCCSSRAPLRGPCRRSRRRARNRPRTQADRTCVRSTAPSRPRAVPGTSHACTCARPIEGRDGHAAAISVAETQQSGADGHCDVSSPPIPTHANCNQLYNALPTCGSESKQSGHAGQLRRRKTTQS